MSSGVSDWDSFVPMGEPAKNAAPETGFLYAIKSGGVRAVKFGISKSVKRRFKELQSGNSDKLSIAAEIAVPFGLPLLEKRVHYALDRFKVRGEWFLLRPITLHVIELMRSGDLEQLQEFVTSQIQDLDELNEHLGLKKNRLWA